MQRSGLEWLWRIKEEPSLWRRYLRDGVGFIRLLFGRVLPYALWLKLDRPAGLIGPSVSSYRCPQGATVVLGGTVVSQTLDRVRPVFTQAASLGTTIYVDMAQVGYFDTAFLGFILVLEKYQHRIGQRVWLINVPARLKKVLRWNSMDYLLYPRGGTGIENRRGDA
jgi:N-acetylglucosaminyldiphosphoundecaprenol N-acetyl-beta-D-mannosaminyltransferase